MTTISVTFLGLCMHLAPGFEVTEILEGETLPTAECRACNKKWIFDVQKRKFVETK